MQLSIKGKQIDVGEALTSHIENALESAVAKYFDNAIESTVVLAREARLLRADISVHVGRGIVIQSHAEAGDAYGAFDTAVEKIAKRLRRYKRRLRDHRKARGGEAESFPANQYILAPEEKADADADGDGDGDGESINPVIVAEMATEITTMTVGEAVMRMDLAELPAMLFRSSAHGGLNMVDGRADGNVGWVDPQGARKRA